MKLVFLDRDGVINKDPQEKFYVMEWSEFHFLPGAIYALKKLNKAGFKIALISNQAGVGKGLFKKGVLRSITEKMLSEIKARGGKIKKVYYCLHRSQDNCLCRKPKTGLLKKAFVHFKAAPKDTFFIGDSEVDVIAGRKIGCKTILVLSGKTKLRETKRWLIKPDYIAKNLKEAVDSIVL